MEKFPWISLEKNRAFYAKKTGKITEKKKGWGGRGKIFPWVKRKNMGAREGKLLGAGSKNYRGQKR